jgi:hypothetical protein
MVTRASSLSIDFYQSFDRRRHLLSQASLRAVEGRQVRSGNRQSIPSCSIANCAGVSAILPSFAAGQTNRHFSGRFPDRRAPCPFHQMNSIRSPCHPRKTTGRRDVQDRVEHIAQIRPPGVTDTPDRRHQRLHQRPFRVGQIACARKMPGGRPSFSLDA